jgi:hypothetical protein
MAERVAAGLQSSCRLSRPMQRLAFAKLAAICFSFTIIAAESAALAKRAIFFSSPFAQSWLWEFNPS